MEKLVLLTRKITLDLPDDEAAQATAEILAQHVGVKVVVTDSEGIEVGTAHPKRDS